MPDAPVATLAFADPHKPQDSGKIVLYADQTVQFVPSPALRAGLARTLARVDEAGQKWGASLLVGLAAIAMACLWRGKRSAGWALFGASGLAGVGAVALRRGAASLPAALLARRPLSQVTITPQADGGLRVVINGGGWRRLVIPVGPEAVRVADREAFMAVWVGARG